MRKIISLILLLTMLIPGAIAEGFDASIDISIEEAISTNIAPLPVDLSGGYIPNPDCYIAADEANGVLQGYEDGVQVTLMDGTGCLDSLRHLAEADIATGLGLGIKLRGCTLF